MLVLLRQILFKACRDFREFALQTRKFFFDLTCIDFTVNVHGKYLYSYGTIRGYTLSMTSEFMFGPLFVSRFYEGFQASIVINDPEMAKHVLVTHFDKFHIRPVR